MTCTTICTFDFYLSGGASNDDPTASIGGAKSSVEVVNSTDDNVFDSVDLDDANSGKTYYRCLYAENNIQVEGADVAFGEVMGYFSTLTPSPDTRIFLGLGAAGVDGTETAVADQYTAPANVTFLEPASAEGGVEFPNLGPGQSIGFWLKLVVYPEAEGYENDYFRLTFCGSDLEFPQSVIARFVEASGTSPSPLNNANCVISVSTGYIGWNVGANNSYWPYASGVDMAESVSTSDALGVFTNAIANITEIHLNNNNLQEESGRTFTMQLADMTTLQKVYIQDNLFTNWNSSTPSSTLTDFDGSNNAFSVTAVNQILVDCDTAGLGTGFTLDLSGGTNGVPSGAGATAKANLISNGASVTTN